MIVKQINVLEMKKLLRKYAKLKQIMWMEIKYKENFFCLIYVVAICLRCLKTIFFYW